jgi:hypothetical protein
MELELESEYEAEGSPESFFGLGESELESEFELEGFDHEFESEGFGEGEFEGYGEFEGEQFFGSIFKKIAPFVKKALPVLKNVAKIAAPMVATAVGGPLGGIIGKAATGLLGESEYEGEYEFESEGESEAEFETVMAGPLTEQQALGELMAAAASKAVSDLEAEAHIGAANVIVLTPEDRDTLRAVLPSINRGAAVLTRVLRQRGVTRPAVRVIPTIVKRTAVSLKNKAAAGQPVTKKIAAKTMAAQTKKVLTHPAVCSKAINRNVKATSAVSRKIRTTAPKQAFAV